MDTSKKYIEICNKATEIQELKHNYLDENSFIEEEFKFSPHGKKIWLPRQDQLQEMIIKSKNNFGFKEANSGVFINNIHSFQNIMYHEYKIVFSTLEECYLSFLMKEEYQKIWNYEKQDWFKL